MLMQHSTSPRAVFVTRPHPSYCIFRTSLTHNGALTYTYLSNTSYFTKLIRMYNKKLFTEKIPQYSWKPQKFSSANLSTFTIYVCLYEALSQFLTLLWWCQVALTNHNKPLVVATETRNFHCSDSIKENL